MLVNEAFCIKRLYGDYKTHGDIIVAFDFDNTVYDYHKQGLDLQPAINAIKEAKDLGLTLFCFTANNDHAFVKSFVKDTLGIEDVAINESPLDHLFGGRKPFYSILLDDRAGLTQSIKILNTVMSIIKENK